MSYSISNTKFNFSPKITFDVGISTNLQKNPNHRNLKYHHSQISKSIIKHIHKILDPLTVDRFYDWNCHPLKFEIKEMYITKNRVF